MYNLSQYGLYKILFQSCEASFSYNRMWEYCSWYCFHLWENEMGKERVWCRGTRSLCIQRNNVQRWEHKNPILGSTDYILQYPSVWTLPFHAPNKRGIYHGNLNNYYPVVWNIFTLSFNRFFARNMQANDSIFLDSRGKIFQIPGIFSVSHKCVCPGALHW